MLASLVSVLVLISTPRIIMQINVLTPYASNSVRAVKKDDEMAENSGATKAAAGHSIHDNIFVL